MSKRHSKKDDFREWVSDNLRYILLGLGILAVLVALFFGVRAISTSLKGSSSASAGQDTVKSGVISGEAKAEDGKAEGQEGEQKSEILVSGSEGAEALTQGAAASGEAAAADAAGASGTSGAAAAEAVGTAASGTADAAGAVLAESTDQDIVQLVRDYYAALSVQDLSAIQKITDTLPEEEAAAISSSKVNYSDVKAYTKDGPDDKTKVVYAYYQYTNGGNGAKYPGLSQMLVRRGVDNKWKLVFSDLDETTANFINNVTAEADVQALIAEVKKEYEGTVGSGKTSGGEETAGDTASAKTQKTDTKTQEKTSGDQEENEASGDEEEEAQEDIAGDQEDGEEEEEDTEGSDEEGEEASEEEGEEASEDNSEEESEDTSDIEWDSTVNSSCNVRSGPGYDYGVIGGISEGSDVTVIGDIDNGWWHIRTDEIDGYIGGKFLD